MNEFCCQVNLDLYDSPNCQVLATQAAKGRHLVIPPSTTVKEARQVYLCEDRYQAWLPWKDLIYLKPVDIPYQAKSFSRQEIVKLIPRVIAFTQQAQRQSNYYLWGGTIGPNYDCSGLIQAAFASVDVWLPRDSDQQAEFTQNISLDSLLPGDLIFFGETRVNHVALYLGDNYYIHSSGKEMGRDGIGIDILSPTGDTVSQAYWQKFMSCGRVIASIM